MPSRVSFHPNRVTITPYPAVKHFEDSILPPHSSISNSLGNLLVKGNPFLISKASKRRLQDRVTAMYRISTPRTITTDNNKLLYNFRCAFITLTLPAVQMHSDKEIKELALNQFFIELRKYYGVENYVWKAELQGNSNIHFHIVIDKYVSYYALRRRWNRILDKLGYIERYRSRMERMGFSGYLENARKYNPKLSVVEAKLRYKKNVMENWKSPNSVDVKMMRNEKDVAVYMSKYISKDIVKRDQESYSDDELELLERGNEFGRSWFCSRSLSRLDTSFSFSLSDVEFIIDSVAKAQGTMFFIGDFFRVWYFRHASLSFELQGFLRGWLLYNAFLANYTVPE